MGNLIVFDLGVNVIGAVNVSSDAKTWKSSQRETEIWLEMKEDKLISQCGLLLDNPQPQNCFFFSIIII